MKWLRFSGYSLFGCTFLLGLTNMSCGGDQGSDDAVSDDVATNEQAYRFDWHRRHRIAGGTGATDGTGGFPNTGGTSSSGGSSPGGGVIAGTCDVCAKANACCMAVSGGPLCSYSSATCSSYAADGQAIYVNSCRTLLTTVFDAWSGNPPAACR
jgi:hypothetical protein